MTTTATTLRLHRHRSRILAFLLACACACLAPRVHAEREDTPAAPTKAIAPMPFGPLGLMMLAGVGVAVLAAGALTYRRARRPALPLPTSALPRAAPATVEPAAPMLVVSNDPPPLAPAAGSATVLPFPAPPASEPPADATGRAPLALHHVDLSIEVLHRHVKDAPREMPGVWLMLLDLCRTHDREQMFRTIASEFHKRFNVRMPQWHHFPPGRDDPGLEAYPRLIKQITLAWGTHECCRLLDGLLYDNRGSRRVGFALNAYQDLIALRRAADAVIESIEGDLAEEVRVRGAYATAAAPAVPATTAPAVPDRVLPGDAPSALEREHPAIARLLAREWGNAALAARLCDMLARGGEGAPELSEAARAELALLRRMAERLAASGVPGTPGG